MSTSQNAYTPPEVTSIIGLIETHIRHREANGPDRGYEIYHPSAFGKCLRLMQYQRFESRGLIKGEGESFGGRMLRLFENGHYMHDRWKRYFEELGVLRGIWVCKNPLCRLFNDQGIIDGGLYADNIVNTNYTERAAQILANPKQFQPRVYGEEVLQGVFKPKQCVCGCRDFRYDEVLVEDKELNFRGHADVILDFSQFDAKQFDNSKLSGLNVFFDPKQLPKGLVVVDMKTSGKNAFTNTVMKTGAHKYYQIQLTIYINVLKCDWGMLIYEEKDNFELASFKVEANPDWWQKIRWQAMEMQRMAADPKPKLPPPRPISKSSHDCKDCPFVGKCHASAIWNDPELDRKRKDFYGDLL